MGFSAKENVLLLLTIVFAALAASLVVVVALKYAEDDDKGSTTGEPMVMHPTPTPNTNVKLKECTTPICVRTAASLLEAMDFTVDPCEDFYTYSCGNWNKKHPIPEDKTGLTRFNYIRDGVQLKLKEVLEKEEDSSSEAVNKVKKFYRSCLNEDEKAKDVPKGIDTFIRKSWPVVSTSWIEASFAVEDLLVELYGYNSLFIIKATVEPDDRHVINHLILIDQPAFGMGSRDYYLAPRNDTHITAYENFLRAIADKFIVENSSELKAVVDFEIELANISTPRSERRNSTRMYNKMSLADLQNITIGFDWMKYLNGIFKNNENITETEEVLVYEPEYIENAVKLIQKTPKRVIANYLMSQFMKDNIKYLSHDYRILSQNFDKVFYGLKHSPPRWRDCIRDVSDYLPLAVGRLFVDNYFDSRAKQEALDLITNLRAAFTEMLKTTNWMEEETRKRALAKETAIFEKIAYPEWTKNDTKLDKHYENVMITENDFFQNAMNGHRFDVNGNLDLLRKPYDKAVWDIGASVVNAFYEPTQNSITFPAGILQPPFYDKDYPKSLIYGGMGLVIGHEITHGFDDHGRQYDKDGNLNSWWTGLSSAKFTALADCIIQQYSGYVINGDHINGVNTQGENIADNGGIKAAYRAYKFWLKDHSEEFDRLPSLNITHDQMFFLNFAQGWCGSYTPAQQHNLIVSDPHSPGRFRIIGALSNSQDFTDAYQCKSGSKMNPVKKCHVW